MNEPSLGAEPFYCRASERIAELSEAIHNYSPTCEVEKMKLWAQEIVLQCDLVLQMRKNRQGGD